MWKLRCEKNSNEGVLSIIKNGLSSYVNDKFYLLTLIITAIGSYGFLVTHYSISLDDLEYDRYYYGELIAQGRLSATIFHRFFGLTDNFIWIEDFLGVLFICIGVILLCVVFDQFINTKNRVPQAFFSCVFVSYPLHSELFSYNGCSIAVGLGLILVAVSLLLTIQSLKQKNILYLILSVVSLFFVTSWYESVVLIYVGMVFAGFLLKQVEGQNYKLKQMIPEGIKYAIPLIIAVVSEYIISNSIRILLNLEKSNNAKNDFALGMYFKYSPIYHIKKFVIPVICDYLVSLSCYFPIIILFFAMLIMIAIVLYDSIKKHRLCLSLCEIMILLFVIGLSPILYFRQPYRTCQYYAFFVAFEVFFILLRLSKVNKKRFLYKTGCFAFAVFTLFQICKINYYFTNDYLRFEYEKDTIKNVGYELKKEFDLSKPVIFIGKYEFPEEIKNRNAIKEDNKLFNKVKNAKMFKTCFDQTDESDQTYYIQETNCLSIINWSEDSFEGTGRAAIKILRFFGYDGIKEPTEEQVIEAQTTSDDMPSWPKEGSIADRGDYIVVKFSNNIIKKEVL